MDAERRRGVLKFEPAEGLLVVGGRTALLDRAADPDAVVGTYVELVVAQRAVRPATHHDLRSRELAELSTLLALPPADLDALIDRELDRLLGRSVAGADARPRAWRRLAFAALLGTAGAGAVSWAVAEAVTTGAPAGPAAEPAEPVVQTTATTAATVPPSPVTTAPVVVSTSSTVLPDGSTVDVTEYSDGTTETRTESAPVPPTDGVDIGSAVVIERDTPPAP